MKRISAYEIALSAISCAFATIFLTVGTLYSPLLFTGYLFACLSLMLPLAKKCYWGNFLAFAGTSALTLLFNGMNFIDTMPFLVFFGLHPLANALQRKFHIRRWVAFAVKAAWFDGSMYLVWRFVFEMSTSVAFIDRFILPILLVGGTAFFILYDIALFRCQASVDALVTRIVRK